MKKNQPEVHQPEVQGKILIGRQEWCSLPKIGLPAIKAKVDTGAQTSALHAFDIEPYKKRGELFVRFSMNPMQRNTNIVVRCSARVVDHRYIMSSNGHKEKRFVIKTPMVLGEERWLIELTLSNRDPLQFRMLLGREAIAGKVLVDPARTYCQTRLKKIDIETLYQ